MLHCKQLYEPSDLVTCQKNRGKAKHMGWNADAVLHVLPKRVLIYDGPRCSDYSRLKDSSCVIV